MENKHLLDDVHGDLIRPSSDDSKRQQRREEVRFAYITVSTLLIGAVFILGMVTWTK